MSKITLDPLHWQLIALYNQLERYNFLSVTINRQHCTETRWRITIYNDPDQRDKVTASGEELWQVAKVALDGYLTTYGDPRNKGDKG